MKTRIGALAAALLAALAAVALAMPAQAATYAFHGKDWAKADYATVKVCDKEADGHRVWAKVQIQDGAYDRVSDKNGPKAGCGKKEYVLPIVKLEVCEKTKGCRS